MFTNRDVILAVHFVNSQSYFIETHATDHSKWISRICQFSNAIEVSTPFFSPTSFVYKLTCRLLSSWSCSQEGITYTLLPLTTLKNPARKINTFVLNHIAFTTSHSRTQPSWCKRDGRTCDCPSCMHCRILHGYGTLRLGKWDTVHLMLDMCIHIIYIYGIYYNMVFAMFFGQVSTTFEALAQVEFILHVLKSFKPAVQAFMSRIKTQRDHVYPGYENCCYVPEPHFERWLFSKIWSNSLPILPWNSNRSTCQKISSSSLPCSYLFQKLLHHNFKVRIRDDNLNFFKTNQPSLGWGVVPRYHSYCMIW